MQNSSRRRRSGAPSIGRSTDATRSRPRSLLLRRQPAAAAKDDDWLSTAALDEVRSPPEGAGLRHRPPSSPHSNHPCGGYNLRPRGCAPPAVKVWQERPCSHLPGASNHVTKHACTHCPAAEALMSLCFVHLLSPRVAPLSCCDGHGMCMLYHGSCGHFHFGAAAALFGTYRMALDRAGNAVLRATWASTCVLPWSHPR